MDFHALPRRDLQALCKLNGVRANMTNAAMADALLALPSVDGVEEYVKPPAAVPQPAGKAAVAEEEGRREKQGSPLPRGRRVTAKTSEVVKPEESKGKEEEKADANREEDAPVFGLGRRGASRRTRPAPVVAAPVTEPAAEKQGNPPPRARREPARPDGSVEKKDLEQEANKEDAPVQGAVRRGPSRRARPAPLVAAPAAEPDTKVAAEEKQESPLPRARRVTSKPPEPTRPDDSMNREKNNDGAPAQVVGLGGPSQRARPAPVVSKPAAKAAVEKELGSPIPRGRRVTFKSPVSTEGGEDEKEDMQREESKGNVQALDVGRRNASRRARPEAAVSAPADNVPAEEDAPVPRGRRGKVKAPEPITLDSGEEEDREEEKLEEKEENAPAHGVARRVPCRRAQPALVEAPATRRRDAGSTTEERDVPVEAVLVRPARVRKPTMKATAAAEQKVPRRTTKQAAATNSTLQKKQQEEPQEVVPTPVSGEACYDMENVEEAADPQNVEQSEMIDEPKQEDKEVLMNEDEILKDETPAEKLPVTDEILVEETMSEEPPATDEECSGKAAIEEKECKDKLPLEEEQVDVEHCSSPLFSQEGSLVEDENEGAHSQEGSGPSEERLDKGMSKENHHAGKEMEMVPVIQTLQTPLTAADPATEVGFTGTVHGSEMESSKRGLQGTMVGAEDGLICQEKGDVADDEVEAQSKTVDEPTILEMVPVIQTLQTPLTAADPATEVGFTGTVHGSEIESSKRGLQGTTVGAEDGLICQEKGDVADDEVEAQSKTVDEPTILDCSGNIISVVEEEKAAETKVSEPVQNEVIISDIVTLIDGEGVDMEKGELVTEELPQGTTTLHKDGDEDGFQNGFVHVDEQKEDVGMEKAEMVTDKLLATMDEDSVEDIVHTDIVFVDEQRLVVDVEKATQVTDKLQQCIAKMGDDAEEYDFQGDVVHVDDENLVVNGEKAHLVTGKLQQSVATLDEDVKEELQTDFVDVDTLQELTTAGNVQVVTKEMQQNTATVDEEDVSEDQLKVAAADKDPKLTGTNGEVHEEEMPQSIGTMNECVQEGYFEIDFVHAGELKKVVTADNVLEDTEIEDEDVQKESAFPADIAGDSSDRVTSAFLDDITNSLSMITITKPMVSRDEDLPMCKNSSEKNAAISSELQGSVCKNSSEKYTDELQSKNKSEKNTDESAHENKTEKNSAEPVTMQENMGVKVAKKSTDLNELSLGQLRAKLKETLELKKAKRVALARVDENVCPSNATGQEQVRKLQQY